ncbi:MAG: hypothetical protein LBR80_14295 [Deltaproteobacteria bacterium]|nr:hypothetical protein [Deltaproteobacteria bacterium]
MALSAATAGADSPSAPPDNAPLAWWAPVPNAMRPGGVSAGRSHPAPSGHGAGAPAAVASDVGESGAGTAASETHGAGTPVSGTPGTGQGQDAPRPEGASGGGASGGSGLKAARLPSGHGLARRGNPHAFLRLHVKGADGPAEAPEIYYRLTRRVLARHGGTPLSVTFHKGEARLVDGAWQVEILAPFFSTIELYSRFVLAGEVFYSQHNFLHFFMEDDAAGLPLPPESEPPADWPEFRFPESSYNSMPFRGLRTDESVDFSIVSGGREPDAGSWSVTDAAGRGRSAGEIVSESADGKWRLSAWDDPMLTVSGDPVGPAGPSKLAVTAVRIPAGEGFVAATMTFSFSVSRNRWSYRSLAPGLTMLCLGAGFTGTAAVRARRRFRKDEQD